MQNAGLAALGLNWRYLAFEVKPDNLQAAILGARAMNYVGLNLTVPHKLLAVDMVDCLDESASRWGAVNTVVFEGKNADGHWRPVAQMDKFPEEIRSHGFNTDADAIARSIREDLGLTLRGLKVVVIGTGGAGRTAALKLAEEGVSQLYLVNRTASKGNDVALEVRRRHPQLHVRLGYPAERMDLVLNASSLGLQPADDLPVDEKRLPLPQVANVYDMIYRPSETPLLTSARAAGCGAANGLGMLLYQGARALELWTGRPAPLKEMREALEINIYGHVQTK